MSWGVVATVKAEARAILGFAAWHLEQGAHRLYIYLDAPCPAAEAALRAHPKCRVKLCDDAWWAQRGGRPSEHQPRQSKNASHALRRKPEVDWLAHIDVDEFLFSTKDIDATLRALPAECLCARIRPREALAPMPEDAPETLWLKSFHLARPAREDATERAYPEFGRYLNGGFLSHVAGKLFARTGADLRFKIHNVFQEDNNNPGQIECRDIALAHIHAENWETWRARFDYRLAHGAYRAGLKPAPGSQTSLHELFRALSETEGDAGLRRFYDEVCRASPALRARLQDEGLLSKLELDLAPRISRQFSV